MDDPWWTFEPYISRPDPLPWKIFRPASASRVPRSRKSAEKFVVFRDKSVDQISSENRGSLHESMKTETEGGMDFLRIEVKNC